ncbi:hypothetical protein [Plantactinospora sp. BB1]|uniref:hypothetical protein n=1 Tax=Plantactinospora sp. BB1 TaxID=2071627 RepID=UPI000D178544|nr:hypothetical protein [Plantactinospora sp. BB1]AVT39278.1 hypothetical protein C6W10_25750 [Plantactinospora sp. BB1]
MLSRYAAPLRDLATGRPRDYQHRIDRFDEPDWRRYGLLVETAFRLAAHRRFRPGGEDRAPVIRFVASVRERYDRTGYDLDPRLAESLLWATLAGEPTPDPLRSRTHTAQTLLLIGLLDDEGLSRTELDRFLSDAEDQAIRDAPAESTVHAPAEPTVDAPADSTDDAPATADNATEDPTDDAAATADTASDDD